MLGGARNVLCTHGPQQVKYKGDRRAERAAQVRRHTSLYDAAGAADWAAGVDAQQKMRRNSDGRGAAACGATAGLPKKCARAFGE